MKKEICICLGVLMVSGCALGKRLDEPYKARITMVDGLPQVKMSKPGKFGFKNESMEIKYDTSSGNLLEDIIKLYTVKTLDDN